MTSSRGEGEVLSWEGLVTTVCPMKYAHGFVVLCVVFCYVTIYILCMCYTFPYPSGLLQWRWGIIFPESNTGGEGQNQYQPIKTKHNKSANPGHNSWEIQWDTLQMRDQHNFMTGINMICFVFCEICESIFCVQKIHFRLHGYMRDKWCHWRPSLFQIQLTQMSSKSEQLPDYSQGKNIHALQIDGLVQDCRAILQSHRYDLHHLSTWGMDHHCCHISDM